MSTAKNLNTDIAWILSQTLSSLGLGDQRKVDVTLRVARQAAINLAPEECGELWTTLFSRLVQQTLISRPDIGELISKAAFAKRAGLKPTDVKQLVADARVLSLPGKAGPRFPCFQIWEDALLAGVEEVNAATSASGHNDYTRTMVYLWPVANGTTILEALRSGLTSEAIEMSKTFRGFLL